MRLNTKAIIIKEQTVRESDRLVTLLTADYGIVRAFVRGAKKVNSRFSSSTSLFSYASFSLYRGKDAYIVDDVQPIEVFFKLREHLESLALAQYFSQLALEFAEEEANCGELSRVLLNAFFLLCKGECNYKKIKSVVELRILSVSGYMPNLVGCASCGIYESETMYFDLQGGELRCSVCGPGMRRFVALPLGVVTAMRYICLSESKKIFSFHLSDANMELLSRVAEDFLIARADRRLTALEFYKSLT